MFHRSVFFLICQLHNIAEQFLKNSCCICCIGLMEYLEVVAHENSLSLRTSWTNVIWNGFAEIHQICKKCIYFTNINLISSGLCNIYSTHYFMAGFLNYISLNSSICRKLFWCVKEGILFSFHFSAQYLSVLGRYTMLIGKCLLCSKHLCHENPKSNGLKVVNSVNLSCIWIMQGIWISTMLVELYEQMNKYHGHKSRTEWYTPYSLLTPWSRVLLEKLTSLQLVKKFPAFYGTRRFITAFVSANHLFLSWASSVQNDILTTI